MRMVSGALPVAVVAACGSAPPPTPPPPQPEPAALSCEAVEQHVVTTFGETATVAAETRRDCLDKVWSAEVISCVLAAPSDDGARACFESDAMCKDLERLIEAADHRFWSLLADWDADEDEEDDDFDDEGPPDFTAADPPERTWPEASTVTLPGAADGCWVFPNGDETSRSMPYVMCQYASTSDAVASEARFRELGREVGECLPAAEWTTMPGEYEGLIGWTRGEYGDVMVMVTWELREAGEYRLATAILTTHRY